MNHDLGGLLSTLDSFGESIGLNRIIESLEVFEPDPADLRPFRRFGDHHYQRNLIHAGRAYHALLLCWRPGQRSPIHDHSGSACGVCVIEGIATETVFARAASGLVFAESSSEQHVGQVIGSFDSDIHQMSNLQAKTDLVTLHIYSPPLIKMSTYSLLDASVDQFVDPIFEFSHGAGI